MCFARRTARLFVRQLLNAKDPRPFPGADLKFRRTPAQLRRLFEVAEKRSVEHHLERHPNAPPEAVEPFRRCGLERAMIYRVGALAGLRLKEIRTLTWGCLDLDSDPPTLTFEAKYAKSRRRDTVPLNSRLAAALRKWRRQRTRELGRPPEGSERVVKVPRHLTDEQFRRDCEFAGIPLRDDTGAVLDLYAAPRHTFCTLLGKAAVAPHRQRLLARHADLATTLRYTHLQVVDVVEGIEALPDLSAGDEVERADYLRNAGCSQAQSDARECNEEGVATGASVEAEGNVKGLPVQDLASPCKAMQEVSNSCLRTSYGGGGGNRTGTPQLVRLSIARTYNIAPCRADYLRNRKRTTLSSFWPASGTSSALNS